jgi:O-antigen/teichoic acid export membrane protein
MAISRNFLMFRSVAFAVVTKISGAAMVFVALPVIAHSASTADYEAFLKAMNVAAVVGLVFGPFMTLTIRELSHAFVNEKADLEQAIQNTFGMQLLLTIALSGCFMGLLLLYPKFAVTETAMVIGITLTLLQLAASWADAYRVANRSDYVTNIIQTAANVILVSSLLALTRYSVSIQIICILYFGIPALSQIILLFHLLLTKRLRLLLKVMPIYVFRKRLHEAIPLSLIPGVDYIKIYLSSMLVLMFSTGNAYILYYTSILYIARLVNPLTLITRPLMPAYIDALIRKDMRWLSGLKKAFLAIAAAGALMAIGLPFLLTPQIVSFALPPEIRSVSFFYLTLCSLFAYGHSLVSLLAPLYIGGHQASFYGFCNLAVTATAIVIGTFFCSGYGALAMMASLSLATTACAIFLLINFVYRSSAWQL